MHIEYFIEYWSLVAKLVTLESAVAVVVFKLMDLNVHMARPFRLGHNLKLTQLFGENLCFCD